MNDALRKKTSYLIQTGIFNDDVTDINRRKDLITLNYMGST